MGFRSVVRVRRQTLKKPGTVTKRSTKRPNTRSIIRVDGQKRPFAKPHFVKFAASSLTCTTVDQVLAFVLFSVLRGPLAGMGFARILVSSATVRCVSLTLNYVLNRRLVFFSKEETGRPPKRESLPRFIMLASGILGLSACGVFWANTYLGVEEWRAKLVVDLLLFFLNYVAQRKWVFKAGMTAPVPHGR